MSITDELRKLQQLHQEGGLTDDEFAAAKAAVLAEGGTTSSGEQPLTPDLLAEVRRQNELENLDREWDLERENYMISGRYGRSIPTRGSSLAGGVILGLFGIVWTCATLSAPHAPFFLPLIGILFVAFGIGISVSAYRKAEQYEKAQQAYRCRRSRVSDANSPD